MSACFSSQLRKLFERRRFGVKFSLDEMHRLCAALGNPERDLSFVHIAGTNGKGSVAAMCAAIFKKNGMQVGLYTSPHLIRYHERFRMNGENIGDEELDSILENVLSVTGNATYFEISTALALIWFQRKCAQIVVWETGLGGRFDATNVVTPKVSIITHVGFDHTQFLGTTLTQIAQEKAGIIKPGIPVLTISQDPEVLNVLENKAKEQRSPFTVIGKKDLYEFNSPLNGEHQNWNTTLAVSASRMVIPSLERSVIQEGLKETVWPGRCQIIQRNKILPIILIDGAHNPMGVSTLLKEIKKQWRNKKITLIYGALADKDLAKMGNALNAIMGEIFLVKVSSERSASPEKLLQFIPRGKIFNSLKSALFEADKIGHPIVITGSLFLVGEALSFLTEKEGTACHPNEQFFELQ